MARCRIRQGTGFEDLPPAATQKLSQSEAQLQDILAHNRCQARREPARKLPSFVRVRLRPEEQRVTLSRLLSDPGALEQLAETLNDDHYPRRRRTRIGSGPPIARLRRLPLR